MAATVSARNVELVIKDSVKRLDLVVTDDNGELIDAEEVTIVLTDMGDNVLYSDSLTDPPDPPGETRIQNPSVGRYYFPIGDQTLFPLETDGDENLETSEAGEIIAQWTVIPEVDGETIDTIQLVKVVSARTLSWVPKLRLIIDKSAKIVDDNLDDPCFLGYTDPMLVQFLEQGLTLINMHPPYPVWNSVDEFPDIHWGLLIDAATCVALTSQELFAVDTDVSYSDQGNVFAIDHQAKLSAILNATWTRLTTMTPHMKRQYLRNGSVRVEMGPNFRLQQMISAAPAGSTFRNTFIA